MKKKVDDLPPCTPHNHMFDSPNVEGKGHKDGGFMSLIAGEHYRRQ